MKRAGFTLLETLVALFIIGITLSGIFSVIIYNLNNASYIKNSFVASGLAQEGIELIRNYRDNDWLANRAFGTSLSAGTNWRVDWQSGALLPADTTAVLHKSAIGLYSYNAGDPATIFKRTIDIVKKSNDEYQVTVTVTWQERLRTPSITAEEHFFNWY